MAADARRRSGLRPAAHAGLAYPGDPGLLRALLDGFLARAPAPPPGPPPRLLVAPHVDYARGGEVHARAWGALAGPAPALAVILGTAHASPPRPFTLTRRDYDTPLGAVPTDVALVDALCGALGDDELLACEAAHDGEHAVELALVWLRHRWPRAPIAALPVLCTSLAHAADPARAQAPFLGALAAATAGRDVLFVAAGDLAHLGPGHGDAAPVDRAALDRLAAEDRATLALLEAGDADGFHRDAVREADRRRICGAAPIAAAVRAAGRGARLLRYAQWTDGVDALSFAAAAG